MSHEYIWATMYGGRPDKEFNKIYKIKKSDCRFYEDWHGKGPAYIYIWGWPGPDYNIYYWKDLGKTWAYELKQFKIPKVEEYLYEI